MVNDDVVIVDAVVVVVVVHVVVVVIDVVPIAVIVVVVVVVRIFISVFFSYGDIFLLTKRVFFFRSLFLSLFIFFYWGGLCLS